MVCQVEHKGDHNAPTDQMNNHARFVWQRFANDRLNNEGEHLPAIEDWERDEVDDRKVDAQECDKNKKQEQVFAGGCHAA